MLCRFEALILWHLSHLHIYSQAFPIHFWQFTTQHLMISRFNNSTDNNILCFCIIYQILLTLFIRGWCKSILNSVPYFIKLCQKIELHSSFLECIIIFIEQRYTILGMPHDFLLIVKLLLKEPSSNSNCWKYWEGGWISIPFN